MYPKPSITFVYGTAGFRMDASVLASTVHRMGLLAALRSQDLSSQAIGVMITASHNPPKDNGVKLVDPDGGMLQAAWETHATVLANAEDSELDSVYAKLAQDLKIDQSRPALVVIGRDTRESSPALAKALTDGLNKAGAKIQDLGIVTTPQLHYVVRCVNTQGTAQSYGEPTEQGYYNKLSKAYEHVLSASSGAKIPSVIVDAANGVGGPKLQELLKLLPGSVSVVNSNWETPASLNVECGADYVKVNQRLPAGIKAVPDQLYASLDGDADRIVFYYVDAAGKFHLLDGDKIATLLASYAAELATTGVKVGLVQTAYANGASTIYAQDKLRLPVVCTPTGVKHLHHAALDFEVGVYFEANGHGTVVFDPKVEARLAAERSSSKEAAALWALAQLSNQTVGDALADLLMVLAVLTLRGWGPEQWDACYTDLPNRLQKAEVADRTVFKTTDAERKLVSPEGMQAKIDAVVGEYAQARSFVRASGTENVVRVYAEADTQAHADELADRVKALVS